MSDIYLNVYDFTKGLMRILTSNFFFDISIWKRLIILCLDTFCLQTKVGAVH
jgi:hypothetical protein